MSNWLLLRNAADWAVPAGRCLAIDTESAGTRRCSVGRRAYSVGNVLQGNAFHLQDIIYIVHGSSVQQLGVNGHGNFLFILRRF